tara:strand:+ start:242 stop:511 length:270 start_codon:yes stop_codon:yes gene_type:complete
MNGLDIVLFNVISYLGGILSGIFIHHKMTKNKKKAEKDKDKEHKTEDKKDKEFDTYNSPVLKAQPVPSAPPPMNPLGGNMEKRITILTE